MPRSLSIAVPLVLVAALAAALLWLKPLDGLSAGTPAVEDVAIERVMLDDAGIHVWLRASGSESVRGAGPGRRRLLDVHPAP